VVGKPLDSIFRLWRTEAIRIGAIMIALIAFVLGVMLFAAILRDARKSALLRMRSEMHSQLPHCSRYFFISARKASRNSARAMP
jgi:hypothetical protein